jgi:SulP family sulfate permease
MVHALTLLLITLFFGRWAALIPLATLAAILVVVSYHMADWRTFASELRAPKSDVIVMLLTFALTVLVDLTVAVEVGLVAAAFLFMKRMSEVTNVSALKREFAEEASTDSPLYAGKGREIPADVQMYAIDGPFFFGAAEKFKDTLATVAGRPRALVLLMRNVSAIDSTGLHALKETIRRFRAGGTDVILDGVHAQPMVALDRAGLVDVLGRDNLVATIDEALERARAVAPRR